MNYHKINRIVAYLVMMTFHLYGYHGSENHDRFDVMTDFAYPILEVEAMRHDVVQGLHFLQSSVCQVGDCSRALNFLEQADCKPVTRDGMSQNDRDTLQNLLDQINGLINNLENHHEHRSDLSNVYLSLQGKL